MARLMVVRLLSKDSLKMTGVEHPVGIRLFLAQQK